MAWNPSIVVGFDDVPSLRDRVGASHLPELAVLSVLAHPELEIAEVAVEAIAQLPEDRARLYLDVIMMALPAAIRQALEARMQRYEYQSDFARRYYGQGIAEGLEQGRQEGLQEGRQEGLRAAVVALARAKLDVLSDDDLAAIEATADPSILTALVTALGQARSAADARAALDQALAR
jgi:predicted transposase YdaD